MRPRRTDRGPPRPRRRLSPPLRRPWFIAPALAASTPIKCSSSLTGCKSKRRNSARLAAAPALRAYTDPLPNPARDAGWIALFEGEALDGLRARCGAGPQTLLAARLAGLEREAEVLEAWLATQLPAPTPAGG